MMNQNPYMRPDRKEEIPPYSRIFVVCNKQLKEDDLRGRFDRFGDIEDLYIPKDRNTGESKGVAYIKYAKTSSAAAAIQELNFKTFTNDNKPTKVMVAVNKNEDPSHSENDNRYKRLFIKVGREATENEIRHYFSTFGNVESVRLHRDKATDTCKGFAYVQYKSFYDTAKAFEECDKKYKPVFATPRDDLKRSRNSLDQWTELNSNMNNFNGQRYPSNIVERNNFPRLEYHNQDNRNNSALSNVQDRKAIAVVCTPQLPQKYIERLFNIIPGMVQFRYSIDKYNGISTAFISYETTNSATCAIEKLNNYEFPSGEIISVKPDNNPLSKAANDFTYMVNNFKNAVDSGTPNLQQLADLISRASSLIKAATLVTNPSDQHKESLEQNTSNVSLPSPKPMADPNSRVAKRLFIICKPQPPPLPTLQDIFCRFGDLIHVFAIPNKTFGFAKYASVQSAEEAINTLNGMNIGGVRLKVMEADNKPVKDDTEVTVNNEQGETTDYDMDSKRMKLDD